jgi:hypothetical protein
MATAPLAGGEEPHVALLRVIAGSIDVDGPSRTERAPFGNACGGPPSVKLCDPAITSLCLPNLFSVVERTLSSPLSIALPNVSVILLSSARWLRPQHAVVLRTITPRRSPAASRRASTDRWHAR